MDKNDEKLIQNVVLWGSVIGVGYLFVVKPLLAAIGISPEDQATIANQTNISPQQNPFNPSFQPAVDLFNANPSYNSDGSEMTMQQYYQTIKALFDSNDPSLQPGSNIYNISSWAEALHDALGFHFAGTDANAVLGAFSQVTNQQEIADMSAYYLYNYGEDLLTALKGSIFKFGLDGSDLATLINRINNLPAQ